jgi:hypothetical protein
MKYFNIVGPANPRDHYYVADHLSESTLRQLIDNKQYVILHAPLKSGKTTLINEFSRTLHEQGRYRALCVNVEAARTMRNNVLGGILEILEQFKRAIVNQFGEHDQSLSFLKNLLSHKNHAGPAIFTDFLQFLCQSSTRPLILFIDKVDSLVGDTLLSVLHQIDAGYALRAHAFPHSICLVGLRDVRDYTIWSKEKQLIVEAKNVLKMQLVSLLLPNFIKDQVRELYLQHTHETGQKFTPEAIDYAFMVTRGNPWLVNVLAYQATQNRSLLVTKKVFQHAKEALRGMEVDGFVDYLQEPLAHAVIDTIIETDIKHDVSIVSGICNVESVKNKARDIANFIYQEIIPGSIRYTTHAINRLDVANFEIYQNADGSLNLGKVFEFFQEFYQEHCTMWLSECPYIASRPHLSFLLFLQCIVAGPVMNIVGGDTQTTCPPGRGQDRESVGMLYQEYVAETRSVNVVLLWRMKRIVILLKRVPFEDDAIEQHTIAEYITKHNAAEGHVVFFDRNDNLDNLCDKKLPCKKVVIELPCLSICYYVLFEK